jgi:hypothetical protein
MSQMTQYYQNKYYQKYDEVEALKKRIAELEFADNVPVSREILVDISETLDIGVARALARKALEAQQTPTEQEA